MCLRVGRGRNYRPDRWETGLKLNPFSPGLHCPGFPRWAERAGRTEGSARKGDPGARPVRTKALKVPPISPPRPPGYHFSGKDSLKRKRWRTDCSICCLFFLSDPPWERMFQTRWRADRAEKGTLPLHAISHPHQAPFFPLPLSRSGLSPGPWDS